MKNIPFANLTESTAFMAKGDIQVQMLTFATAEVRMSASQAKIIAVAGNSEIRVRRTIRAMASLGFRKAHVVAGPFPAGGRLDRDVDAVFKLFNAAGREEEIVSALDKAKLDIRSSDFRRISRAYVQSEMKRSRYAK